MKIYECGWVDNVIDGIDTECSVNGMKNYEGNWKGNMADGRGLCFMIAV